MAWQSSVQLKILTSSQQYNCRAYRIHTLSIKVSANAKLVKNILKWMRSRGEDMKDIVRKTKDKIMTKCNNVENFDECSAKRQKRRGSK